MKRLTATLALALLVLGCGPSAVVGAVPLLTGQPFATGCFTNSVIGRLIADKQYGTAIVITLHDQRTPSPLRSCGVPDSRVGKTCPRSRS